MKPNGKETPGEIDEDDIYRLHIPMEAYDLVHDYRKVVGLVGDFSDECIPMLSMDSDCGKSIRRIIAAVEGKEVADNIVDHFIDSNRNFLIALARGFGKMKWLDEGEKIALERANRRKKDK